MAAPEPLASDDVDALLRYAELTYRSVTSFRRRVAVTALVLGVLLGLASAFCAMQWLTTRSTIAGVEDSALVEAFGVEIPDPRPAVERGQLRVEALLWAFAAGALATLALFFLGMWALARPGPAPPPVRYSETGARRQPPM